MVEEGLYLFRLVIPLQVLLVEFLQLAYFSKGVHAMLKKLLTYGIIILLIFWVATDPDAAARAVSAIGQGLANVGNGLANFLSNLT